MSLGLSNKWVRALMIASLVPGIILAGITYFFVPLSRGALDGAMDTSLVFVFLVSTLIGARLVSEDRRQGAFLAHFSRPVTRLDYLAGKFVALALPVFLVAIASGVLVVAADAAVDAETYAERIAREQGIPLERVINQSTLLRKVEPAEALFAIVGWGAAVAVATTGIVLGVSALTTRARIAGVAWFAIVAFGAAAHGILQGSLRADWPALLSWQDGLTDLSSHLVGLVHDPSVGQRLEFSGLARFALLALASLVGLAVVHEQIRRAEGGVK